MSEFEDKLNTILSDPDSMDTIMKLAQSLGEAKPEQQEQSQMPDMAKAMSILGKLNSNSDSRYMELLSAIKPYLKDERQARLERAIKISKLSKIAKSAMESGLIGEL